MSKEKRAKGGSGAIVSALIIVVSYCLLAVIIGLATLPSRYDIRVGQVSPVTITATKDVEDTVTTNQRREAAAKAVEPSYVQDSTVAPEVLSSVATAFNTFVTLGAVDEDSEPDEITEEMRQEAADLIDPVVLSEARLNSVLASTQETLRKLADQAIARVRDHLNLNIAEGQESDTLYGIQRELVTAGWDNTMAGTAVEIIRPYLRANMLIDEDTTELNRQKARDEVEAVMYIKGQNIVRAGEIVTRAQIEMLNSLGLLKEQGIDYTLLGGAFLLVALLMTTLLVYLWTFEKELLRSPRHITLLMTILVITVLVCWAVMQFNVYLMPAVMGIMLTVYLMKPRLALMNCIVLAVFSGLIASGANGIFTASVFTTILTTSVSGALCIGVISHNSSRTGVLLSGLLCGAASMVTAIAIGLTNNANFASVLATSLWASGSGVLAGILTIGLTPILEAVFNLTTTAKLFDLSNPNQPLLRRLMLEAPGTYHHSIVVANLAEAAANAIGANGLLARVGAYYHDIGKLKRPLYFRENQIGDNPHDRTDPRVSAAIILAHPHDGVQMAAKERVPESVRNIIERHHGSSTMIFFYDKALKQANGENVDPADFTYDAPLPKTREEACVMLADPVEATSRTLQQRDPQSIGEMVDRLINQRIQDGDLNECRLTFADIGKIREAFVTVLTGVYHERIAYPDPPPTRHSKGPMRIFMKPVKEEAPAPEQKNAAPAKPAPKPAPEAKPAAEPKPEAKPAPEPKPVVEPKTEAKPVSEGKPAGESKPAPEAKPAGETKPEAKPAPEPEPAVEPKTEAKPVPEAKPAGESKPAPAVKPVPKVKTEAAPGVPSVPKPSPAEQAAPASAPEAEKTEDTGE